jgi:hypothetical protein
MNTVVDTTYQLVNRKLFSLPKVLLLPVMIARQPMLMAKIFPIIFTTDWMKGRAITYMTMRIETLEKEQQELDAMRSKVEAFDIKNAELLQRAGKLREHITSISIYLSRLLTNSMCAFVQRVFRSRSDTLHQETLGGTDCTDPNQGNC